MNGVMEISKQLSAPSLKCRRISVVMLPSHTVRTRGDVTSRRYENNIVTEFFRRVAVALCLRSWSSTIWWRSSATRSLGRADVASAWTRCAGRCANGTAWNTSARSATPTCWLMPSSICYLRNERH